MSKTPRNELAIHDFAKALEKLLKTKEPVSLRKIERWAYAELDLVVTAETFRRAFDGETDPTACSIELLVALMAYFEVGPADLGAFAEHRLTAVFAAAGVGGDGGTPPGTRTQNLRVFGAPPRRAQGEARSRSRAA